MISDQAKNLLALHMLDSQSGATVVLQDGRTVDLKDILELQKFADNGDKIVVSDGTPKEAPVKATK